jgi:two-component system, OmpR family, sensor kinase
MSLANRLLSFFLGLLALVLTGFSVGLYLLVQSHLDQQANRNATGMLDALQASVEINDKGLEWEGAERQIEFGLPEHQIAWVVLGANQKPIDGKPDQVSLLMQAWNPDDEDDVLDREWDEEPWRLAIRTLKYQGFPNLGQGHHTKLTFITGVSLVEMQKELASLRWALFGLSGFIFATTTILGRFVCRRALLPVREMARTAHSISAEELDLRLPCPEAKDELHELATAFNQLLMRMQQSFEKQRRFSGEASHQLRTPLTAILGQLDVALRRERDPEEYRRVLQSVRKQSQDLHRLIEMLLFLARPDGDAIAPEIEELDLYTWLSMYLQFWSNHPRFSDLKIVDDQDKKMQLQVSPLLLEQAIGNLIENACKYSHPGTPITIEVHATEEGVELSIADMGIGISLEDQQRLFEPFFRSNEARRQGIAGVGLGLAITRRFILLCQGDIHVESQPGIGSRFVIVLPYSSSPGVTLSG